MKDKEVFVPIEDIAAYFTVSHHTVRQWIRKGHIARGAYIKAGNTYRFKLSDVLNSLLSNGATVDPTEEGAKATVRSSQKEAEEKVKSYIERKEAASPAEMEDLFDEDM
jgi:excisionase family DNA binding protein